MERRAEYLCVNYSRLDPTDAPSKKQTCHTNVALFWYVSTILMMSELKKEISLQSPSLV